MGRVSRSRHNCTWCGASYLPRGTGGRSQIYCSPVCRIAFHRSLRRWAQQQADQGRVTVQELHALHRTPINGHVD